MPIWGEIELFCHAIADQGRQEAEKILNQARTEADKLIRTAQEQAENKFQKNMRTQRSTTHTEAKRLVDSAELEARKRIIAFRKQVIQDMLSALEQRLNQMKHDPEYPDFLVSSIKEGIQALPGTAFIVEIAPEDLDPIQGELEILRHEWSLQIQVATSSAIKGGARIYTDDRRMRYDNSFSARLQRHEDAIRKEIWEKIFGTEPYEG